MTCWLALFMDKRILLAPVVTSGVWKIDQKHRSVELPPP